MIIINNKSNNEMKSFTLKVTEGQTVITKTEKDFPITDIIQIDLGMVVQDADVEVEILYANGKKHLVGSTNFDSDFINLIITTFGSHKQLNITTKGIKGLNRSTTSKEYLIIKNLVDEYMKILDLSNVKNGKDGKNGLDGKDGIDGRDGVDGVGIESINKTTTSGNTDTYTITFTNGKTKTFNVTNGRNGSNGKDGTNGKDGVDGKSAYDIAVELGFKGSQEEWIESLHAKDESDSLDNIDFTSILTS